MLGRGEGRKILQNELRKEVEINKGVHFCLFWSKWLKLAINFRIYCTRTTKMFHNKIEIFLLCKFTYTIWFKGMSMWKESHPVCLPLHQFHFQIIMHFFTMLVMSMMLWGWEFSSYKIELRKMTSYFELKTQIRKPLNFTSSY